MTVSCTCPCACDETPHDGRPCQIHDTAAFTARAIELAYGLLWLCPTDRATNAGELAYQARQALLPLLDRDGKLRGLKAAQDMLPAPESRTNSRTPADDVANALIRIGKRRPD